MFGQVRIVASFTVHVGLFASWLCLRQPSSVPIEREIDVHVAVKCFVLSNIRVYVMLQRCQVWITALYEWQRHAEFCRQRHILQHRRVVRGTKIPVQVSVMNIAVYVLVTCMCALSFKCVLHVCLSRVCAGC